MIPILAFIVGVGLGLFYCGGLWLTVRQLIVAQHPYRLIFFSFILRLGVTLFVVSLVISGDNFYGVIPLLICCLGFLAIGAMMILPIQPRSKCQQSFASTDELSTAAR